VVEIARTLDWGGATGELGDGRSGDRWGKQRLTVRHTTNRPDQIFGRGVFEQEVTCPRAKRFKDIVVSFEGRQDHDARTVVGGCGTDDDLASRRQSIHHRHLDVHQHNIGSGRVCSTNRSRSVFSFPNDLQPLF
jgi:hypothetical protein